MSKPIIRAAIYSRKSTNDNDKEDDLKSVALQEQNARRLAKERGWVVLDEHCYRDDMGRDALRKRSTATRATVTSCGSISAASVRPNPKSGGGEQAHGHRPPFTRCYATSAIRAPSSTDA